jgi:hypothetical protein
MPATEPGQKQRQVGSDTPVQARSRAGLLLHRGLVGWHRMRQGPQPLGPTAKRLDADPPLLSTKHAALPPTASDAVRCHLAGDRVDLVLMTAVHPNPHGSRRCPMPCDLRFSLIERRPAKLNLPLPHRLSTLRSPATMHKTAGQGHAQFPCEYKVFDNFWRVVEDTPVFVRCSLARQQHHELLSQ